MEQLSKEEVVKIIKNEIGLSSYVQIDTTGVITLMIPLLESYHFETRQIAGKLAEGIDTVKDDIKNSGWFKNYENELREEINELKNKVKQLEKYENYIEVKKELKGIV